MSTATVKLKHGALATVTPDFMITRGITETHSLTLLNADNTALINASVVTWTFQIAQDFLSRTSILAESTSITFADNVLSGILLNAHTVELKAFMQGKAIQPLYGTLIGLNGSAEVVTAITFRIVCTNSVYEPDAEPTPAIVSQFYTAAQVDVKFAAISNTLGIPTDINELNDADGLLFDGDYNSLQNIPAIPADVSDLTDSGGLIPADLTDLTDNTGILSGKVDVVAALPAPVVGILNHAYFLTAADGEKAKGTAWKCIADGESYIFQQIQTDLASLTDTTGILSGKVDKETGKGLSTNDFTTEEKNKLANALTSIPDASTSVKGAVQLATAAEVTAGTVTDKAVVPYDLATELAKKENTANKATDFSTVNNTKYPTVKAVKEFVQNETLTELTGSSVTVAPWTQTKYTADGVCTITATGWALSGFQWSQIVITVLPDAVPAIAGTEELSEDDALSGAGVYHAAFINLDGKIYFHVSSFVGAA